MHFTLKQLQYFVAAAECGSVKGASEAIHISQPSISAAVTQLEAEFGVQLFLRHHARGLSLTQAGRRLLRESRSLLTQADHLYNVAREINEDVSGPLGVGCFVTLAPLIAPQLIHEFSVRFENSRVSMVEGDHETMLYNLRKGSIDIAIGYDLQLPEDCEFEDLVALYPHALLAPDHPLSECSELALSELVDEPFILLDLPYSREYFLSLFYQDGLTPQVQSRSSHQEVVRTMVANGYGYTLANVRPLSSTALDGKPLVSVPLKGNLRPMRIGLIRLKQDNKPRLLVEFEKHCRQRINQNQVPGMAFP